MASITSIPSALLSALIFSSASSFRAPIATHETPQEKSSSLAQQRIDPCAVVGKATTQAGRGFPSCRCDESALWVSQVSVYCGARRVAGRHFNATEVLAQRGCLGAYCGYHWSVLSVIGTCGAVGGASTRDSKDYPLCKCPYNTKVYCEKEEIMGRKFNATEVLSNPDCYAPYCATEADPERTSTTTTTSTTRATTTTTTTTSTTPTSFNSGLEVDASHLFSVAARFLHNGREFKCCANSETNEVAVQDMSPSVRPKAQIFCKPGNGEGCGCMFGDKWHNAESSCRVKLSYLSSKTGTPAEELYDVVTNAKNEPTVDVGSLFSHKHQFLNGNKAFKCCAHSKTNTYRVQDITQDPLPRSRKWCTKEDGCGCMFGDSWHSFSDKCDVAIPYLSVVTGVPAEELQVILKSLLGT